MNAANSPSPLIPEDLVVHRRPMLLLDTIQDVSEARCIARVEVDPGAWYADAQGAMPGWFGIELMAQTVSAYSGYQKRLQGQEPRVGFLLGSLKYELPQQAFPGGQTLEVEAKLHFLDETGLSAFRCEIRHQGHRVACAMLKTFEPV
ncbi:MAG: 3-hydroxylacyl-ACP dehydratase [Holophaga sp.]|nr:3-hydroxylacyl-ACP dehydratase [Holophaga sp.]